MAETLKKSERLFDEVLSISVSKSITPIELSKLIWHINNVYNLILLFRVVLKEKKSNDLYYPFTTFFSKRLILDSHNRKDDDGDFLISRALIRANLLLDFEELNIEKINEFVKREVPIELQLRVHKITINSPGNIDLLGLGEVVRLIRDFIITLLNYKMDKDDRELERRKKVEEIATLRLENIARFMDMCNKYNLDYKAISSVYENVGEFDEFFRETIESNVVENIEIKPDEE